METRSEVPVRFYKSDQVLPVVSMDEPNVPPSQDKHWQVEAEWDFMEIQIDGTTDKWMVVNRLDKP